jgi:hypothetical protein
MRSAFWRLAADLSAFPNQAEMKDENMRRIALLGSPTEPHVVPAEENRFHRQNGTDHHIEWTRSAPDDHLVTPPTGRRKASPRTGQIKFARHSIRED